MNGFFDIFSILLGCYGVYFLYIWFCTAILKRPLPESKNILPSDLTMQTCNDPKQFTAFILPWLLITGLSLVAYAIASYFLGQKQWFIIVMSIYFVLVVVYYLLIMRTARRRFWPDKVREKKKK